MITTHPAIQPIKCLRRVPTKKRAERLDPEFGIDIVAFTTKTLSYLVAAGELVAEHDDVVHLPNQTEVFGQIVLRHLPRQ